MSQPTGERDVDTEPEVTMEMKAAGADVLVAFRDSYDDWTLVEAVYKAMWHLRRIAEQGTLAAHRSQSGYGLCGLACGFAESP